MSDHAVKLADVAREANVHASTVSRVLSRPQLIGEPTRLAVHAAIDKLGYIPNRAARQLAGGRTGSIGMLVPDITNPYFAHVVRSVQRCCGASGHTMLLADTDQREDVELTEARALASSVDGFVVCTPVASTQSWLEVSGGKPLVFVNRRSPGVASVVVDQSAIVELGVAHLRGEGHESIAVVRGPSAYWSARQRDRVIRSFDGVIGIGPVRPEYAAGMALAEELLSSEITGVVAFNDLQALGIIAGIRSAGGSIPGDMSVVGSDDIAPAVMSHPPLTTVAAPMQQLGEAAFNVINELLDGTSERVAIALPVSLAARESTGPPNGVSNSGSARNPTVRGTQT